ncbi:MAG: hypothetical protein ACOYD6_05935 [Limnochordia bacterium]
MQQRTILAILILLLVGGVAHGAVGARPWGMGGAYIAVADDAAAVYYNPAGLMSLQQRELVISVGIPESKYDHPRFAAYVEPDSGLGAGGISWVQRQEGETTSDAFVYSYARTLAPRLTGGVNFRYERHKEGQRRGSNYSVDLAALYELTPHLQLGFLLQDFLATPIKLTGDAEEVPLEMNFRPGLAYRPYPGLQLAVDIYNLGGIFTEESSLRCGGEWTLGHLALRAGLEHQFRGENRWTAGFGYGRDGWEFNYAWVEGASSIHHLGFAYRF